LVFCAKVRGLSHTDTGVFEMRISGKSFALAAALVGAATSAFAADTKTKVKPDVSCPPAWGSQDFPPYVAPAINGWDPLHLGYMKYKLDPAREDRAVCETPVPNAALGFSVSNEKEICFPVNSIPDVRVLTLRTATGVRLLPFSLSYKGVKLAYAVYERKCRGESDAAPLSAAPPSPGKPDFVAPTPGPVPQPPDHSATAAPGAPSQALKPQ
jgi:hypothetical protein